MSDALVIEVVRKTVTVDCAVEEAFRVFTTDAISWWPVESHSIYQTVREIVFEPRVGGEVYELSDSGERGHWATVRRMGSAEPSRPRVEHPRARGRDTEVEVRFVPDADGNQGRARAPRLGERLVEGSEMRGNYDTGWDFVLGRVRRGHGAVELTKPAKPLVPRDGGIRW